MAEGWKTEQADKSGYYVNSINLILVQPSELVAASP